MFVPACEADDSELDDSNADIVEERAYVLGTNLALGKTATQSSTDYGGAPSRAVDGNTDGNYFNGSVTHTATQDQAWWQVDLESVQPVGTVVLHNRTDCCADRLSNFRVRVSNDGHTWQDYPHSEMAPEKTRFDVERPARYVRVQLDGQNPLSLAEVEVFASDNLALGKTATQSSTDYGGDPSRAVDGDTDGNFFNGSVTYTANENQAWWQVDLESVEAIGKVVLHNRTDCCGDRLSNFRLSISSDNQTWQDYDYAGTASDKVTFSVGAKARYVRVQLDGQNPLSLAEVEIFRPKPIVVFAPHPDDDIIVAGGVTLSALKRGQDVVVVYFTNGGDAIKRQPEAIAGQQVLLDAASSEPVHGTVEKIFLGYWQDDTRGVFEDGTSGALDGCVGEICSYHFANKPADAELLCPQVPSTTWGTTTQTKTTMLHDLECILLTYQPDHIFTTSVLDTHGDHYAAYMAMEAAIDEIRSQYDSTFRPTLHSAFVHSTNHDKDWPFPPGDPTLLQYPPLTSFLAEQASFDQQWADRESINVAMEMQVPGEANVKAQALAQHRTQDGHDPLNFIRGFVTKDEFFFAEDVACTVGEACRTPVHADAGADQWVTEGASVTLHATVSGGDAATYRWTKIAGPDDIVLAGADSAEPTFTIPGTQVLPSSPITSMCIRINGHYGQHTGLSEVRVFPPGNANDPFSNRPSPSKTYVFELVVTDSSGRSSVADSVAVHVFDPTTVSGNTNLAAIADSVTAGSENQSTGQVAERAVDGVIAGWGCIYEPVPERPYQCGGGFWFGTLYSDYVREWVTTSNSDAWLRLTWNTPIEVGRVVLHDRPSYNENVTSATVTFNTADCTQPGSAVYNVAELPINGSPYTIHK